MIVDVYDQSPPPHLRPGFTLASADDPVVAPALDAQRRIVRLLSEGYAGDEAKIADARRAMLADLEGALQSSAAAGRGVPLFAFLEEG